MQITRVEALPNPVFYGSSCGSGQPTTLSVRAWVNDPSQVLQLQVEWKFPAAPAAPGQAMLMNPDGNGAYSIDLYSLGADSRLQGGSGEVMVTVSAFDKQQNYVAASPVRVQVLPCTAPAPPSITPTVTPSPIPAMQTRSGYVELHDSYQSGDKADMDFSGVPELVYFAPNENGVYYGHSLGQYVGEGEGICMTQVSSPSFEVCKAYQSCSPGIGPVQEGETYCYHTWNDVYGYFHIDKIENRAGFDMPDDWVISLSYTVWLP
ncbi:MAG: hypothetical protein D6803_08440 [Anaerolineae bacterium]|nr:MAG: hypothetical protein D6803_08440 [Anaerolineae bacterium]